MAIMSIILASLYAIMLILTIYIWSRSRNVNKYRRRLWIIIIILSFSRAVWFGVPPYIYEPSDNDHNSNAFRTPRFIELIVRQSGDLSGYAGFLYIVLFWASVSQSVLLFEQLTPNLQSFIMIGIALMMSQTLTLCLFWIIPYWQTIVVLACLEAPLCIMCVIGFIWYGRQLYRSLLPQYDYLISSQPPQCPDRSRKRSQPINVKQQQQQQPILDTSSEAIYSDQTPQQYYHHNVNSYQSPQLTLSNISTTPESRISQPIIHDDDDGDNNHTHNDYIHINDDAYDVADTTPNHNVVRVKLDKIRAVAMVVSVAMILRTVLLIYEIIVVFRASSVEDAVFPSYWIYLIAGYFCFGEILPYLTILMTLNQNHRQQHSRTSSKSSLHNIT